MDERDRAAVESFGGYVGDHESVRRSAEAAVGEQRHAIGEARAHNRARHAKHFAHTRSAARTLVTDHHHIAGIYLAFDHRVHGIFLALEHSRGSFV